LLEQGAWSERGRYIRKSDPRERMAGAAGLGRPLFSSPAAAAVLLAPCHRSLRSLAFGRRGRCCAGFITSAAAPCRYRVQDRQAFLCPSSLHDTIPSSCVTDGRVFQFAWKALGSFLVGMGAVAAASEKNALDVGAKEMTGQLIGARRGGRGQSTSTLHGHRAGSLCGPRRNTTSFPSCPPIPGVTDEIATQYQGAGRHSPSRA